MQDLFTEQDLADAVDELATLPYFPSESRGAIMTMLRRMCPSRTALRWLVSEAVNHLNKWPGMAELRGILCMRYDAADGIDQWSTLSGYRPEDGEMEHLEAQQPLVAHYSISAGSRAMIDRIANRKTQRSGK